MPSVTVDQTEAFLTPEMSSGPLRFHAIWLRDNAQDPETRAVASGQRLIALRDIPADPRIEAAEITAGGTLDVRFAPEDKSVSFDLAWLEAKKLVQREKSGILTVRQHANWGISGESSCRGNHVMENGSPRMNWERLPRRCKGC